MKIAVQMDPLENVNPAGDTTFAMIEEAQSRGFSTWVYGVDDLFYDAGDVKAWARPAKVFRRDDGHCEIGERVLLDLRVDVDVILMRQDPPFHMGYLTAAHLLELVKEDTLVVNDPAWVASSPEKVFPLIYPELQPPTLISRSLEAIQAFRKKHKDIVLKPLYGHGGASVVRVKPDDGNFEALVEMFQEKAPEPFIAQAFLPDVTAGDKRIILVDGEPCGAINRMPPEGAIRSNLVVGGTAQGSELTERELEICAKIGPELKRRGLIFVGIDVIGNYMTEVNVTSPTGAQAIKKMTGIDPVAKMWDVIQAKFKKS
ncbi:glutathione synthase [Hirschia baltica]|uniref:Glutathione synthetase n=1 Tax=Hirschia baltica (strain ATCC 49814 / DSM 5838 / IFAM 1418) TaxID=582402 RepID=C6XIG5_HIRBI|nr:glutathione synthase [Hirschia baltica]ACT60772.1 glutathione synthetase [Hirschia baltica ATCC 49814]